MDNINKRLQALRTNGGMTLVEIIVASVVFVILVVGVTRFFLGANKTAVSARQQVRATMLMDKMASRLQSIAFENVLGADSDIQQGSLNLLGGISTTAFVSNGHTLLPQFDTNPHGKQYYNNYFVDWSVSPNKGILEDLLAQTRKAGFSRFQIIVRFARTDSSDISGNQSVTDFTMFYPGSPYTSGRDDKDPNIRFESDDATTFEGTLPLGITRAPDTGFRIASIQLYNRQGLVMARSGIMVSKSKLTGDPTKSSDSKVKFDIYYPTILMCLYDNGMGLIDPFTAAEIIPVNAVRKTAVLYTTDGSPDTFKKYLKYPYHDRKSIFAIQGGKLLGFGEWFENNRDIWRWGANYFTVVSAVGANIEMSESKVAAPFFSRPIAAASTPNYTINNPIKKPGGEKSYELLGGASNIYFDGLGGVTYFLSLEPALNSGVLTKMYEERFRWIWGRANHNGRYSPWGAYGILTDLTPPQVVTSAGNPIAFPPSVNAAPLPTVTTRSPYVALRIHDIPTPSGLPEQLASGLDVQHISISTSTDAGLTYGNEMFFQLRDTAVGDWRNGNRVTTATVVLLDESTLLPKTFDDNTTYDLRTEFVDFVTYGTRFPSGGIKWGFKVEVPAADLGKPTLTIDSPPHLANVGAQGQTLKFKLADPESGINPGSVEVWLTKPDLTTVDLFDVAKPGAYCAFGPLLNPDGTPGSGGFEVQIPYSLPHPGSYSVNVKADDWAGNALDIVPWDFSW